MTSERGLDGDLSRLNVTNLTDHDDIRVLAKDRPQPRGKGQLNLRIHLHLPNAPQLILNGVFDGNDIFVTGVNPTECSVQRGCLAGTGGSSHQHDTMTLQDQLIDNGKVASTQT